MQPRAQTPPLSVAPMMDRTDRFFRLFMRQITRRTLLYTEMVTSRAVLHGDRARLLDFDPSEHPIALQLGGSDPAELAQCARIAEAWGYDEVNLNVGCPSDRVQSGAFGACLMKTPELVAQCVAAMRAATDLPVTVKHRIGVDDLDRYEDMARFVTIVSQAGADRFSVHARKAWLKGLSPKANRNIPPIRYDDVYRLKADFPHLPVEINGHIQTLDETLAHLARVDAVMIGRAAWDSPFLFAEADRRIFQDTAPPPTRHAVAEAMKAPIEAARAQGTPPRWFLTPMLNLFAGVPGTRRWKRTLVERGEEGAAAIDAGLAAVAAVQVEMAS
jgi:tRNA-dihydrouridine synthase A